MRMDAPKSARVPHADVVGRASTATSGPSIPDWVPDAVFYHVFPDRFANGDAGNDPPGTLPWGSAPTNDAFMGGDLIGVRQQLGYLNRLGVSALYFNPIFSSPSNHRYDITDYHHVDDRLGGDAALKELVDAAHGRGMKVMLDGVFNHTSHQHPWFKDVRERGPQSPYFSWYDVTSWPIKYTRDEKGVLRSSDYRSWWNYATLPELRTDTALVRDYFLTGKDAVVKRWIRDFHIDGWRMDVADEVEPEFWRTARTAIKATNPNTYMVAENWHDASSMLQGDQFDGAMNYKYFQQPAVSFFAHKSISSDEFIQQLRTPYAPQAMLGMFNILDSHDTPRFITEAGGDWYRLRPAAIFQMTYVGAPVIYYGDELAMEGAADPDSRRAFPWNVVPDSTHPARPASSSSAKRIRPSADGTSSSSSAPVGIRVSREERSRQMFSLYQTLIATRTKEPALRRGAFQVLSTHNDNRTLSYRRWVDGSTRDAVVALNNDIVGHDITVPVGSFATDGTTYTDALSGARLTVANGQLLLPGIDGNYGAVLVRDTTAAVTRTA